MHNRTGTDFCSERCTRESKKRAQRQSVKFHELGLTGAQIDPGGYMDLCDSLRTCAPWKRDGIKARIKEMEER
jgi:hypothetical protein